MMPPELESLAVPKSNAAEEAGRLNKDLPKCGRRLISMNVEDYCLPL
jgi:hypothetical protein